MSKIKSVVPLSSPMFFLYLTLTISKQKALMIEKDRQVVTRQEAELRRVHELDRRRRHTIGAAETNLAAKRRGGVSSMKEIWHCPSTPSPIHPPPPRGHYFAATLLPCVLQSIFRLLGLGYVLNCYYLECIG